MERHGGLKWNKYYDLYFKIFLSDKIKLYEIKKTNILSIYKKTAKKKKKHCIWSKITSIFNNKAAKGWKRYILNNMNVSAIKKKLQSVYYEILCFEMGMMLILAKMNENI